MKILAAGDIHGDSLAAKKLAEKAVEEKVDLVIITGDLTYFGQEFKNVLKPFQERNLKTLIIPGNHESVATTNFLAEIYNMKNIHGYSLRYNDLGIFGAGGSNIGTEAISEKEFEKILKNAEKRIDYLPKKIMVTHTHPSGTKMEKFTKFFPGSSGIRKAIEELQPDIALCSHVHEAEGIEEKIGKTKVINVGKHGKIIEI